MVGKGGGSFQRPKMKSAAMLTKNPFVRYPRWGVELRATVPHDDQISECCKQGAVDYENIYPLRCTAEGVGAT